MNQMNEQTNRFKGNILALTKSMLAFGLVLPIVNLILPTTLMRKFEDLVQVGKDWEYQIRSINSLMVTSQDTQQQNLDRVDKLDAGMQSLAKQYGLTTQELSAAKESFSTLNVVLNDSTTAADDLGKGLQLTTAVAKLSRAGFSDMNEALQATFTAMSAGQFTTSQTDTVMDRLFETIKVGRVTFQQFNKDASTFIPMMEEMISVAPDAAGKLDRLTQGLELFSAASLTMGSPRAAVGIANIFRDIGRANRQQQQLTVAMESLRKRGQSGLDIRPQALLEAGPVSSIETLAQALGPNSPLVNNYIAQKQKMGKLDKSEAAEREAASKRLIQSYFGEARAVRAFEDLTANGGRQLTNVMKDMETDIKRGGIVDAAVKEWTDTMQAADDRLDASVRNFQLSLFRNIAPTLVQFKTVLRESLNTLVDDSTFQRADIFGKLQMGAVRMLDMFSNWFEGPGRRQVQQMGYRIGNFLAEALAGAFKPGKNSAIAQAAFEFSNSFAAGVKDALPDLLTNALTGAVGEGLLSYILFKKAGLPTKLAAPAAVAFAGQMQGMGGPVGQAGAIGLGGIGLGILGIMGAQRIGRMGIPGTGGIIAQDLFAAFRSGAAQREALLPENAISGYALGMRGMFRNYAWERQSGPVGPGGLGGLRGRFMGVFPGLADVNTLRHEEIAAATSPGARRLNMARGLGIGIGGLAAAATALSAPADTRWHDTLSMIGGLIGGGLGAGVGGLIGLPAGGVGGLITGAVGSAAGWGLGSMSGGMLGDWFDAMGRPKGGIGGGAGDSEASKLEGIQAMIFALNNSQITTLLEQMRGLMMRAGGGTGPAKTNATGVPAGGGAGDLTQFFTSQIGDRELSNEEALAACGPAAAVFFARANGKNPTLKQALDVAKGKGWTTAGMPSIQSLNETLSGLGAPGTVGGVDWNRLAQNAQAGIPGIVNIGPTKKFPGHFFQIGGYDPNNGFNVGPSGSVLTGGSSWMTAAQMSAFGPAIGAIYGTGSAVGGGAGSQAETEAYIRQAALVRGIDPDVAVRAWIGEGRVTGAGQSNVIRNGIREPSFGPYQLYMNGGWGNSALAAGIDPRNPAMWRRSIDFALDNVKQSGWTSIHGAGAMGIGPWQGIGNGAGGGAGGFTPDMVGSGRSITINGPLIGSVTVDPSGMNIYEFAGALSDALDALDRGGSTSGQGGQIAP